MDSLFTQTEAKAWGGLISAYSRVSGRLEDDLRRNSGISRAEYEVLLRLFFSDGGRLRIAEIADRSLLTRSGMSRLVDRLERAGLVERHGDEDDRRGAYAAITAHGRDHFTAAATRHTALVRELFLSHFTDEEQKTLASFWDRLDETTEPGANRHA